MCIALKVDKISRVLKRVVKLLRLKGIKVYCLIVCAYFIIKFYSKINIMLKQ